MKTKMILMLVFLNVASATAMNPTPINDDLLIVQMEIQKILAEHPHEFTIEEDYVVYVEITMNDNNEICTTFWRNIQVSQKISWIAHRSYVSCEFVRVNAKLGFQRLGNQWFKYDSSSAEATTTAGKSN